MNTSEESDLGFGFGMFFGVLLVLVLMVTTPVSDNVKPADYIRAANACSFHGGLEFVTRPSYGFGRFRAQCKENTYIFLKSEQL